MTDNQFTRLLTAMGSVVNIEVRHESSGSVVISANGETTMILSSEFTAEQRRTLARYNRLLRDAEVDAAIDAIESWT